VLKFFDFLHFYNAFFKTVGHVVYQAVQKSLKGWSWNQGSNLLSEVFVGPETLKDLGTIVTVLEFCEKHTLTSEFNINIKLEDSLHKVIVYNARSGKI
jgi:hypothetical protein